MQILILDLDKSLNVKMHSDFHLKQAIVSAKQLLNNARNIYSAPPYGPLKGETHPVSIWTCTCDATYSFIYDYFILLLAEYTYRFNKRHDYDFHLFTRQFFFPPSNIPWGKLIDNPLPKDVPSKLKHLPLVEAYQAYVREYFTKAARRDRPLKAAWTRRSPPDWFSLDLTKPINEI